MGRKGSLVNEESEKAGKILNLLKKTNLKALLKCSLTCTEHCS